MVVGNAVTLWYSLLMPMMAMKQHNINAVQQKRWNVEANKIEIQILKKKNFFLFFFFKFYHFGKNLLLKFKHFK